MPRRTPDQGVRPFEFRTGVGGLPPFGGMFRSGDPATIPPHKHHLMINTRITPSGVISRPGLSEEFSTGIEECIVGITEFRKMGGGVTVWPGAEASAGNGSGPLNPISMRTIFPTVSNVYSEYNILLDGALDYEACSANQPIIEFQHAYAEPPNCYATGPFIYEGQIHRWKQVTGVWECWTAPMPESAETMGTDLYRARCCYDPDGTSVPTQPPAPCPPGSSWPRGHPFSTATFVFELPDEPFGPGVTVTIEGVRAIPERDDQALDGSLVVQESLYVIVGGTLGDVRKTKVYRWNGTTLTEEPVTIADLDLSVPDAARYYVQACDGGGKLYVFVGGNEVTGDGGVCWVRDEDGAWTSLDGLRDGVTPADFYPVFGFVWAGVPYFLGLSNYYAASALPLNLGLILAVQSGGEFILDTDITTILGGDIDYVSHTKQVGPALYILAYGSGDGGPFGSAVVDFDIPTQNVVSTVVIEPVPPESYEKYRWLEVVSTTVYLGGKFVVDLVLNSAELEPCHAVYDVTDPTAVQLLYRVYDSERPEYDGNTYSQGALPLIPASGETGG